MIITTNLTLEELKNPQDLLWIDKLGKPYARNHTCDFNFLRPEVRNAYKRIIAAYRDKFKVYKHFRGISLNEHPAICFGSLDNGYGEWTVALFTRETGIHVPGDTPMKRAQWLLSHAKNEWIAWRCRKVADAVRELAETLRADGNTHLQLQYWIRGDFNWNIFEKKPGEWNFSQADQVVKIAREHRKVIFCCRRAI